MSSKNILTLLLALLLAVGQITPALAADTAAVMKLSATEGTVTVCNASARELTVKDDMRLYNGYTVETAAKSYAWINLDDSKLVKLDASTKVEIRKSGKKLEVLVNSGNIYGDVSKKLDSDETLNVRTSTAVVGIRGTKYQVAVSDAASNAQTVVTCMEGSVTLTTPESGGAGPGSPAPGSVESAPGPEQSATKTVIVSAGQTATVTSTSSGAESTANDVSVSLESAQQSDLTGSTQVELTRQGDYTMTPPGGEPITLTPGGAAAQQAADQQAAQQRAAENAKPDPSQPPAQSGTSQEAANPVWGGNTGNSGSGSSDSGSSGSSSGNSGSSSGGSGSGGGSATPSTPGTPSVTTYTVTFDANGGAFNATSAAGGTTQTVKTVEAGGVPSFPEHPTRAGYEFSGWYTDESCTRYFATPVTANMIVYAGWRLIEYKVNLNGNGGNFDGSSATITILTEHGQPLSNPPEPGRDGYSFAGWYTDSACTNAYDITADVTSDLTLYAKWIENTSATKTYTATFVSNGGSAVDSKTIIEGAVFTPPTPPWRDYHTFGGWYTDQQCTDGNEYTFYSEVDSDITLYAKWTDGVTITCDPNGGKFADGTSEPRYLVTDVTGKLTGLLPALPEKDGYLCTGWYRGTDLVDDEYAGTFKEAETLYAQWATLYTVTFYGQNGTFIEEKVVASGAKLTRPDDPILAGYSFDSWYKDASWYKDDTYSYAEEWDFDGETVSEDTSLYAHWFGGQEALYVTIDTAKNLDMLGRMLDPEAACEEITLSGTSATLTLESTGLAIPAGKTLHIPAGVGVNGSIFVYGNLYVDGGEVWQTSERVQCIVVDNGGVLYMTDEASFVSGGVAVDGTGSLIMTDGKIRSNNNSNPALTVNGIGNNVHASIEGGLVDGSGGVALYMMSGTVSGNRIVSDKLSNVLQVDNNATDWVLSGICDYNTTRELYVGVDTAGGYILSWVGDWNYFLSGGSGSFGTNAALVKEYTGSINCNLSDDLHLDLNGYSITLTNGDVLKLEGSSIILTNSGESGQFVVKTPYITIGTGTIKTGKKELIVLDPSVTDYEVTESGILQRVVTP